MRVSTTYSPQGDGNLMKATIVLVVALKFQLPIPRKGTETPFVLVKKLDLHEFQLPLPRKGTETIFNVLLLRIA